MSSSESEYDSEVSSGEDESDLEYDSDDTNTSEEDNDMTLARNWVEVSSASPPPAPPRFQFTGQPEILVNVDDITDVLKLFEHFMNDDIIGHITTETNRYAREYIAAHRRAKPFTDLTSNELRVFLGLILLQGIVRKPEIQQYWSKNPLLLTPFFTETISVKRFKQIKQYLHFSNNAEFNPRTHPFPKLNKIWPILEKLTILFKSTVVPERDVTIDESLLLFKGRLSWKQFIPLKRARFGIKSFMLCESKTGYVWNMMVYCGKGTMENEPGEYLSMSSRVVIALMNDLFEKGYCLTIDNFYTSPEIADILISKKTDVYGTVKLCRQQIPDDLKKKNLKKKKMKKGDIIGYQRGKVTVMAWQDKKTVSLLSTVHTVTMTDVEKRGQLIKRPDCVMDYNFTMGGVDRVDQHLAAYATPRKRGRKYYKKIFYHLLDLAVWNSFVLYQKSGGTKDSLWFRLELIQKIMEKYHSADMKPKGGRPSNTMHPKRLSERHFPEFIPATEKKTNPTRQCAVCSRVRDHNNKKIRRESRYHCPDCDVALCVAPCFRVYHTVAEFWEKDK